MNNVISLEHSVTLHIENVIIDTLSHRAGKWVAPHVIILAADKITTPIVNVYEIINRMVKAGVLEKSFHVSSDKFDRAVQVPLYRLVPNYSLS